MKPLKMKPARDAENRDRKRDKEGWKAARATARKNKARRVEFEQGEKF
ncbi:hypothetical protein vBRpoSV10_229 [Ruegeria phage vB_RpoS-V10]|nr:hypothetical protein DSS3P8_223 [Roseobacter phage DSS3P8]AWY09351.1 hypothetical protein vBRpoSV10_229 [Ruegeria phage vB_RpoS-V10]